MAEFIVNPRRAPRAPARCRTAVVSASGSFEAETEDIGAYGCQVVSPKGVRKGDPVRITIANDKVPNPIQVAGSAASSKAIPTRHGKRALTQATRPVTWSAFGTLSFAIVIRRESPLRTPLGETTWHP